MEATLTDSVLQERELCTLQSYLVRVGEHVIRREDVVAMQASFASFREHVHKLKEVGKTFASNRTNNCTISESKKSLQLGKK